MQNGMPISVSSVGEAGLPPGTLSILSADLACQPTVEPA
ncbi:hypothetical protein ABH920_003784 [Catenulispora sp. EB89]